MFKDAESAVKSLTVLGKSLILALTISTTAIAQDNIPKPNFIEYNSNAIAERVVKFSFGWYKKLDEQETEAYHQSVIHALEYAENGEKVSWYRGNASGYSVPVMTWPANNSYCRRLHLNVIAFNQQKAMSVTACHNSSTNTWTWYKDK